MNSLFLRSRNWNEDGRERLRSRVNGALIIHFGQDKAPFTRERNRSVPYRSVPKSGTLMGCVHTGTLEITSFRSKKWNDKISDTKYGTKRNRSVPFPCEQAMRCKTGPKNGTIRFLP